MFADALAGWKVVRERRWIVAGLSCDIVFNLALASYFVLGPVIFEEHFDGARDWGLMMTAGAIGGLLGGLVVLRLKPSKPLFVAYLVSFVTPLQLIALALRVPLAVLIVGSMLVVVAMVLVNTYWETMQQQHVPAEYLSRVDSLGWTIALVAFPIGMVVAGPVSSAIGTEATLIGSGLLAAAGLVGTLSVRDFRELRRLDEQPRPASPFARSAVRLSELATENRRDCGECHPRIGELRLAGRQPLERESGKQEPPQQSGRVLHGLPELHRHRESEHSDDKAGRHRRAGDRPESVREHGHR